MEKLILFLIVFGVGSFFEYLKKKREQRADSVVGKIFGSAPAAETAVQPAVAQKPKSKPKNTARKPPLPVSSVQTPSLPDISSQSQQPLVLPDEGGSIFDTPIDEGGNEQSVFAPGKQEQDLSEHYQRWRRAIIDSEILQRKF